MGQEEFSKDNDKNTKSQLTVEEKKRLYFRYQKNMRIATRDVYWSMIFAVLAIAFLSVNQISTWWWEVEKNTGQKIPSMQEALAHDPNNKYVHNPFINALYSAFPATVIYDDNGTKMVPDYTGKAPEAEKAAEQYFIADLVVSIPVFFCMGEVVYYGRKTERLMKVSFCKNCGHTIARHISLDEDFTDGNGWRSKGCNHGIKRPADAKETWATRWFGHRCKCTNYEDGGTPKKVWPISYIMLGFIIISIVYLVVVSYADPSSMSPGVMHSTASMAGNSTIP